MFEFLLFTYSVVQQIKIAAEKRRYVLYRSDSCKFVEQSKTK